MGVIDDWYTDGSILFKAKTSEDVINKITVILKKLKLDVKQSTNEKGLIELKVYNSGYIDVTPLVEDLAPYYDLIYDVWICPKGVIYGEDRVSIDDILEMKQQIEEEAKNEL